MERELRKELEELANEYNFNLKIVERRRHDHGHACANYSPSENLCVINVFPSFRELDFPSKRMVILHEFSHCVIERIAESIPNSLEMKIVEKNAEYFGSWLVSYEVFHIFWGIAEEVYSDFFAEERTGNVPLISTEGERRDMFRTYKGSRKEKVERWKSMFVERFKDPKFDITRFRADIAYFHQLISVYRNHKKEMKEDKLFNLIISAIDPEFLRAGARIVDIILHEEGNWIKKFEKAKPFLKKEIHLIFSWLLGKKSASLKDIMKAIKELYTRSAGKKERAVLTPLGLKEFEDYLKALLTRC